MNNILSAPLFIVLFFIKSKGLVPFNVFLCFLVQRWEVTEERVLLRAVLCGFVSLCAVLCGLPGGGGHEKTRSFRAGVIFR
jgi:hypothetical protein